MGAPVAIAGADAPKAPACSDDPKSPNVIVSQIKDYTKAIDGLEIQISQLKDDQGKPLNEVNLKELAAQIQALQTMVTEAQKKITLTVKGTIDPGSGFLPDTATHPNAAGSIPKTGLIAGIAPTAEELLQKKWFKGAAPDPKTSPLLVNVYLDFEQALLYMATENPPPWKGASPYQQTKLTKAQQDTTMDLYRDVAYIPLLVWKGDRENDRKGIGRTTNAKN